MIVSVFGKTEKRPILYTLMKVFQATGDTCLVTNDRRLKRLTEDGSEFGHYQNVEVYVCDVTADELWQTIEQVPEDFDHQILDNILDEDADVIFYVKGAGDEPLDEDLFDMIGDHPGLTIVEFGFGKNPIPYSVGLFKALERIEYYRKLEPVDDNVTKLVSKVLAPHMGMTPKAIAKVVAKK